MRCPTTAHTICWMTSLVLLLEKRFSTTTTTAWSWSSVSVRCNSRSSPHSNILHLLSSRRPRLAWWGVSWREKRKRLGVQQHSGDSSGLRSSSSKASSSSTPSSSSSSAAAAVDWFTTKRLAQSALELYQRNVLARTPPLRSMRRLEEAIQHMEREQSDPHFWNEANAARAKIVNASLGSQTRLLSRLRQWSAWEGDIVAALEILQPTVTPTTIAHADPNNNDNTHHEEGSTTRNKSDDEDYHLLLQDLHVTAQSLLDASTQYELELLLSGPYDTFPARLVITAGAGGTEANDWVSDLYRMYQRHCERMGFTYVVEDKQPGEVTGYKSVELIIQGDNAYGWLQGEKGAHRLVRLSPFNANNKRQTTFAGVDVAPLLEEDVADLNIPESELEITTMRSGGKGGQNVNKVNSAVRIRHIPSGLQVKVTQDRSQSINKDIALNRLKSQLLAVAQEQRVQEIALIRGDQVVASWGTQIRNYILHPYRLIKDQRTGWETTNVQAVLDGDLKDCIGAYLRYKTQKEALASLGEE